MKRALLAMTETLAASRDKAASNLDILEAVEPCTDGIEFPDEMFTRLFNQARKRARFTLGPMRLARHEPETIHPLGGYNVWVIAVTQSFDRAGRTRAGLPTNLETALALAEAPTETYVCRMDGAEPVLESWLTHLLTDLVEPPSPPEKDGQASVASPLFVALGWLCAPQWPKVPLVIPKSLRPRHANRGQWSYTTTLDRVTQFSMDRVPNVLLTRLHVDTLVHLSAGLGDTIDIDADLLEEDPASSAAHALSCPPTAPYIEGAHHQQQPQQLRKLIPLRVIPASDGNSQAIDAAMDGLQLKRGGDESIEANHRPSDLLMRDFPDILL